MSNGIEEFSAIAIKESKDLFWAHRKDLVTDDFLKNLQEKNTAVFYVFVRLSVKYYWSVVNMPLPKSKNENENEGLQTSFYMMQFLLIEAMIQDVGKLGEKKDFDTMQYFWKNVQEEEIDQLSGAINLEDSYSPTFLESPKKYEKWIQKDGKLQKNKQPNKYWNILIRFLYELRNAEHHSASTRLLGLFQVEKENHSQCSEFYIKTKNGTIYKGYSFLCFETFKNIFERNFLTHFINYANE